VYYQMPVLADVPPLVRGLILQGIRKQMSPAERMNFVPILQEAAEWKKVVQFAAADNAYVIVLDSGGQVKWRTHGRVTGEAYSQLKRCITDLQVSALSSLCGRLQPPRRFIVEYRVFASEYCYSQRKTFAESAAQTTKTTTSAATSPAWANQASPFQIPWSKGTA
jgi:hypothetical protein